MKVTAHEPSDFTKDSLEKKLRGAGGAHQVRLGSPSAALARPGPTHPSRELGSKCTTDRRQGYRRRL